MTLQAASKVGYDFKRWEDAEGNTVTEIALGTYGHLNLKAIFEIIVYHITYQLNDGINHQDNPTAYTVDSTTILLSTPTKVGHTFDGWYLDDVKITEISTGATGDKVLVAVFNIIVYEWDLITDTIFPIN